METPAERAKRRKSEVMNSKGEISWWKPQKGYNEIIVFPAVPAWTDKKTKEKHAMLSECEPRGTHYDAPNGEAVTCPKVTLGKRCYLCDKFQKAKEGIIKGDKAEEIQQTCKVSTQFLYNVIDKNDPDSGVQVLSASQTVHEPVYSMLYDEEEYDLSSYGSHFKGLRSIRFKNTGKGALRYKEFKYGKPVGAPYNSLINMRKKLHDVKALATRYVPSYEETKMAYKGLSLKDKNEREDGDDVGKYLKSKKKKGKFKKKGD